MRTRSVWVLVAVAALAVAVVGEAARGKRGAAPAVQKAVASPGDVRVQTNMTVNGTVTAKNAQVGQLVVKGDAEVTTLTVGKARATLVSADVVETGIVRSPTGTIIVDGNLMLSAGPVATSFLALDVEVGGVKQWKLVEHDDFEGKDGARGWSAQLLSNCKGGADHFLGGLCGAAAGQPVEKEFTGLPPHTQLRVVARYHFIDEWSGESGFATVEGQYVWAETNQGGAGLDVCGGEAPERRFGVPVDATTAHTGASVKVAFGSSLRSEDCSASWGVDDVMVYVR